MANDDFARALIPLNTNGKGTVNTHAYLASTATDLAIGMPVRVVNGLATRAAFTGMVPWMGVITGFSKNKAGSNELKPWLKVSDISADGGSWYVQVADDPDQEYFIQEDTGGTALTSTAAGNYYADIVFQTTSIDTVTGIAKLELDATSAVESTAALLHIVRLHDYVNSDGTQNAVGDYAKWVVVAGHHQKRAGAISAT